MLVMLFLSRHFAVLVLFLVLLLLKVRCRTFHSATAVSTVASADLSISLRRLVVLVSLFILLLRSAAALYTVLPQYSQQLQHHPQYVCRIHLHIHRAAGFTPCRPSAAHRAPGPPPTPAALKARGDVPQAPQETVEKV